LYEILIQSKEVKSKVQDTWKQVKSVDDL